MHDAHFHDSHRIHDLQQEYGIPGICNVSDLQEYEQVSKRYPVWSMGVHPWKADETLLEQMIPYMKQAPVIGEIGMDSLWCRVPMDIQEKVFVRQLKLAKDLNKPVILHTKGMEKRILEILRTIPNTYVIHWYSSMHYLDGYQQAGTYFTIGPSIGKDRAVTKTAQRIPMDRMLLESDGIGAVLWATGHGNYVPALRHTIREIAKIRNLSEGEAEKRLDDNFARLLASL
ncbi:MAG: TatD family hydrolase [Bulleidia sp.]